MNPEAQPRLILVIEDDANIMRVVKRRLEVAGYRVFIALDGTRGLELAQTLEPDLIVLDLQLPGKDGFEICRELKFNPKYHRIPILMLTARTSERDITRGMITGADGYMTKPFDSEELLQRIEGLLRRAAQGSPE